MKKESVNMDKDFREKLASREIAPSPAAWDRLDAMLNVAEQKNAEKPVFRLNYWLVAAAVSAVVLGALFSFNPEDKTTQQVVETPSVEVQEGKPESSNEIIPQQAPQVLPNLSPMPSQKRFPKSSAPSQVAQTEPLQEQLAPKGEVVTPKIEIIQNPQEAEQMLANSDTPDAKAGRIKVDANALLSEVDGEVTQSFRERVLISASKKFESVKTALANRNQK